MNRVSVSLIAAAVCLSPLLAFAAESTIPTADESVPAGIETEPTVPGPDDLTVPLAQPDDFTRGIVTGIVEEGERTIVTTTQPFQIVTIRLTRDPGKGKTIQIDHGKRYTITEDQRIRVGQAVVIGIGHGIDGQDQHYVADQYRLPMVWLFVGLFFLLAIAVARLQGFTSILGLVASGAIIGVYVIPQIVAGQNPLTVCLFGALAIAIVSIYLAHGFTRRTSVALLSTLATLLATIGLGLLAVRLTHLTGHGSEAVTSFQFGPLAAIDLRGLLLGGMMLGTLGVLDDITTAQAAIVDELQKANEKLGNFDVYKRAMSVGKEHITSLVNTLFLAYVGVSLPLFLYFYIDHTVPVWVILNGQFISEEIIRTLVGSTALILAVPITTLLATLLLRPSATRR